MATKELTWGDSEEGETEHWRGEAGQGWGSDDEQESERYKGNRKSDNGMNTKKRENFQGRLVSVLNVSERATKKSEKYSPYDQT